MFTWGFLIFSLVCLCMALVSFSILSNNRCSGFSPSLLTLCLNCITLLWWVTLTLSPPVSLSRANRAQWEFQGRCGTESAVNSPLWASSPPLRNRRAGSRIQIPFTGWQRQATFSMGVRVPYAKWVEDTKSSCKSQVPTEGTASTQSQEGTAKKNIQPVLPGLQIFFFSPEEA